MESGLPSFLRDFTCPVVLRIPLRVGTVFGYRVFTFSDATFQSLHLTVRLVTLLTRSYNPTLQARWFGLFRFRSPLLSESRLIYFPPGTEMVHFPGLAHTRLCIQRAVPRILVRSGFPHSDIPGSKLVCSSPRLIAACHVLHRLLAPRHPPYALSSLTIKLTPHVAKISGSGWPVPGSRFPRSLFPAPLSLILLPQTSLRCSCKTTALSPA